MVNVTAATGPYVTRALASIIPGNEGLLHGAQVQTCLSQKQRAGVHVIPPKDPPLGSFPFPPLRSTQPPGSLRRAAASSRVHCASEAPLRRREVDPDSRQRTLAASRRKI